MDNATRDRVSEAIEERRRNAEGTLATVLDYAAEHDDMIDLVIAAEMRARTAEEKRYRHSYQYRAQAEARCLWCMWPADEGPTYCSHGYIGEDLYGPPLDIAATIRGEEASFIDRLDRWRGRLPAMIPDPSALDGDELAQLHHTHGIEPDLVEALLGVTLPDATHEAYQVAYDRHRQTGARGGLKTTDDQ